MSSLPNTVPLASDENATRRHRSRSHTPPPSIQELENAFESWIAWPATRCSSLEPTEDTKTTILGACHDGGTPDNTSSVTLHDDFPRREVEVKKNPQSIPSTIVPVLLEGVSDISPPRSLLDSGQDASCEVDKKSDLDALPRYSAAQKGKWRAHVADDAVDDNHWVRTESLVQFDFPGIENPAEDWLAHSRPILQEYADRQTSLPLGKRLEVSIDEPSQFILGVLHLLVNRDKPGDTDRSRRLGPRLIENFLDIERWAREYFRSRHATQVIDSDVPTLLTIIINNFYEGQVQLIDRLVEFALENMQTCGRNTLGVEDFAFGFDFRMSQDMPFYVETRSRLREHFPIRPVETNSTVEPVITSSGRQVKPTKRAQESIEQVQTSQSERQKKGKNPLKDKQTMSGPVPTPKPKKSPSQPSGVDKDPEPALALSKTTRTRTKHRPTRPSNLSLPPIMPESSAPGTIPRSNDSVKPKAGKREPAGAEKSDVVSDPNLARRSSPRLKIKLPPMRPKGPAASESASMPGDSDNSTANAPDPSQEHATQRSERVRPRGPRNPGGGDRGRGAKKMTLTKTPEVMSLNTANAQTIPPLGVTSPVPSAVNTSNGHSATNLTQRKSLAGTSSAGSHETVNTAGRATLRQPDPGHPRRKKRKLDECDD